MNIIYISDVIGTIGFCILRGVRNVAKLRTRFRIFMDSAEIQGFSGDSGIQRRFRDSVKIQLDSVRFGGIHQDSIKIQLGNFQLPRSHSCICARDKQFPFDHVISIRKNPVKSVIN